MSHSSTDLHPLGVGQIFDRAFRLFRKNFVKFIGIVAIVQVPLALLSLISNLALQGRIQQFSDPTMFSDPNNLGAVGSAFGVIYAVTILLAIVTAIVAQISTAAMTRTIADEYLGVDTGGILDAYKRIGSSWVSLIFALIVLVLVGILIFLWTLVPCVGWLTGPGMSLFLTLVITPLIAPVVVLEKQSPTEAFSRAWELARSRFWWVLGFMFLLTLLVQMIVLGPSALVGGVAGITAVADPFSPAPLWSTILSQTVGLVLRLLVVPLQLACITLVYFDLRVRREGFDLAVMAAETGTSAETPEADAPYAPVEFDKAAVAGISAETVPALYAAVPDTESSTLPTSSEMGRFVLLTLGFIAIYAILFAIGLGIAGLISGGM